MIRVPVPVQALRRISLCIASRALRAPSAAVTAAFVASLITACAGVVSQNSANTQPQGQTYTLSGVISPSAGGSGASVVLTGASSATATADSAGNYTFSGLANGSYTVTPSRSGYAFSPSSQNATVNGSNLSGINFTASPSTAHSVTATWTASSSAVLGYNVYRGSVSGGPYTKLNGSAVTVLTYTDATVGSGQTYFYVTTAVDASGNESVFSNEVKAVIP